MTITDLNPIDAPTKARPMPVLPAVPSTMVPPGRSAPRATASLMMYSAARSLTDWPGFMNSALPRSRSRSPRWRGSGGSTGVADRVGQIRIDSHGDRPFVHRCRTFHLPIRPGLEGQPRPAPQTCARSRPAARPATGTGWPAAHWRSVPHPPARTAFRGPSGGREYPPPRNPARGRRRSRPASPRCRHSDTETRTARRGWDRR